MKGILGRGALTLLAVLLVTACDAPPDAPRSSSSPALGARLTGEWVSEAYLERLRATRSPRAAATGEVTALVLEPDGAKWRWRRIVGFHESIEETIDADDVSRRFVLTGAAEPERLTWRHDDGGTPTAATFVRAAPTLASVVNGIVIAGTYEDARGARTVFEADGMARLPDRTFRYAVDLDTEGLDCDTMRNVDDQTDPGLGFAWRDGRLLLFTLSINDGIGCAATPRAVLTPTDR